MNFFFVRQKRHLFFVFLSFLILPWVRVASQPGDVAQRVKAQAELMVSALIRNDWKTFGHYANPGILKIIGGQAAMEQSMGKVVAHMKETGIAFSKMTVGEPSRVVKVGTELECTLPLTTEMKTQKGTVVVKSTLVAVSLDGGTDWTFLDAVNKDVATVKLVWPQLSPEIVIPPTEKFMKNGN